MTAAYLERFKIGGYICNECREISSSPHTLSCKATTAKYVWRPREKKVAIFAINVVQKTLLQVLFHVK